MNNNDMIVKSLKEYVQDSKTSYAVLMTAPWGAGKTYFAKHTLCKRLEKVGNKKIYYISLNGIKDINQIAKEVFYNLELFKEAASTTIDILQTALSDIVPLLSNIKLKKITTFIKDYPATLSDCVLIFDDYERCECKHAELLGYINHLVEHNSCKVIIIANEDQIKEKAEYKTLQEKVIGYTLKFEGDFYNTIDSINGIYLEDNKVLCELLSSNKDQILTVVNEYKHYNLRTYIFFLSVIKRIYNICSDKELIINLIGYVFEICVKFKTRPQSDSDPDYDRNVFYISSLQVNQLLYGLVYDGIADNKKAKPVLENYAKEISGNLLDDDNPVNVLVHWDEHSNEDISEAMAKIKANLLSNKYGSDACAKTMLYACYLQEKGFNEDECKSLCDSVCDYLETNNIFIDDDIDMPRFNVLSDTNSFYKHYVERIKQINSDRESNQLIKKLKEILEADDWGVQLENYILESKHTDNRNLFDCIDTEFLLSKINEYNPMQIKHFTMALASRYSSANFYEFYYSDFQFLEKVLQEVNTPPENNQIAIEFQINKLKEQLNHYVKKIEEYKNGQFGKG